MKSGMIGWGFGVCALAVMCAVIFQWTPLTAQAPAAVQAPAAGPKYTVIDTEGTNLLVVDNSSNTLYYYTTDQGKEVGEDLILRGSLDLNEVGKGKIKPKKAPK
jgi:hypothetical protein